MACEKQMPPLAALVFMALIIFKNTYLNYIFNILHIILLRIIIQAERQKTTFNIHSTTLIKINKKEVDHMKGIICIGRQYGSGGREVGESWQETGIPCYDSC